MSFLAPLLEIQDLDLAVDVARKRSLELSERTLLPGLAEKIAQSETELTAARARRSEIEAAEHALSARVGEITREIEAADLERYSGKRKGRDEAAAHNVAQQALRDEQSEIETQEMALLESIDVIEEEMAAFESKIGSLRAESEKVAEAIRKVESEVEAAVASLLERRSAMSAAIPEAVLTAYERVRSQPRSGGRGATSLAEGRCAACRIQLPSLERRRMMAEPEDAVIQCPQCRRVLVRE